MKPNTNSDKRKAPANTFQPVENFSLLTDLDMFLFKSGKHFKLYEKFGSHVRDHKGVTGTYFCVWAPNAAFVSVIGNWNHWNHEVHKLLPRWDDSGIWEGWIANIGKGEAYKYFIKSNISAQELEKSDPFAHYWERPPQTASIIWDTWYEWKDQHWMELRKTKNQLNQPFAIYEVHLGSWRRSPDDPEKVLGFRDLASDLVNYAKEMHFTHVELMPLMEHPFYGSWGYQVTGFYAPTSRFGEPQDLMYLIEELHKNEIGVILDWVPSHFPGDAHGLMNFDGTALYEHADSRKGFHPDWKSYIFNYGRNEVRSFLISNAFYWLDRYHIDGLRVDAVASMLHLDYSRKKGEWLPNIYGGRENLEAISFIRDFNSGVFKEFPDVQTIAEESTSFPKVTHPVYNGGLGFSMKWMMGWMNDTLKYFSTDPIYRKHHHHQITFSIMYAFTENFVLPFSHDEVVHLKKSLLEKMPGDEWQRFANLRTMLVYQYSHPGTKLLFQGCEMGQYKEWNHDQSIDWHLLQFAPHKGLQQLVKELNKLYTSEPALYSRDFSPQGFEWMKVNDAEHSVLIYCRNGTQQNDIVLIALNLTPVARYNYRTAVPLAGTWKELICSDDAKYWGAGFQTRGDIVSEPTPWDNKNDSMEIDLPPLSAVIYKYGGENQKIIEEPVKLTGAEKAEIPIKRKRRIQRRPAGT
ncbi:MAG: 1,4-alpha-glucan branching protein GlgB [Chitinophagales bacterium]|nr:1,4-alpha-glucan branching protein GlgB [Chitinophagales bacterium]